MQQHNLNIFLSLLSGLTWLYRVLQFFVMKFTKYDYQIADGLWKKLFGFLARLRQKNIKFLLTLIRLKPLFCQL